MLTLLLGRDWVANRSKILQAISEDISNCKGNRILLVPELISHEMERRLSAAAGDTVSRYAEVLSFTRLVSRVAEYLGRGVPKCLDNGGRVVAMASAVRQLHSQLKAYASVETKPEFLTGLVDAVDEFKRCCITPNDLKCAAAESTGSFSQKLNELSLIQDAYDGVCLQGKQDPRDLMTWLLEQMEDCAFAAEHVFYIEGFPDFTNQNLAILEHIIANSPSVTVCLTCDRAGSSDFAFEKAGQTAVQLLRIAEKLGVDTSVQTVAPVDTPLSAVYDKLYSGKTEQIKNGASHLHVYRTNSVFDECIATAQNILSLVKNGARYRQISVVCADINAYKNLLRVVFNRCHIPLYLAGNDLVLEKPVIATVLYALDAVSSGFEQKYVLQYIKSACSPLKQDLCDKIENYAIVWGISGNRWKEEWSNHPDGLNEKTTPETEQYLFELNSARARIIDPLLFLQRGLQDAKTLRDQVVSLYRFLEQIQIGQSMADMAEQMDATGDNRSAQILNQLWEILLTALEQLYDTLGSTSWNTDTFIRLLRLLLGQYEVGTIPTALDAVVVGSVSSMRCQKTKHLFVLGALEGSLPGYSGSSGVLTDQERTALRRMGIPLTGGALDGLQAEFSEIHGVFSGASDSIYVSCPSGQPSFIYRRMAALAGGEETVDTALGAVLADTDEAAAFLARYRAGKQAGNLGLGDTYDACITQSEHSIGCISCDGVKLLYGNKLNLSASQIDKQANCRLAYFLKYGLRAKERKTVTVDPAEFGTYVHWVLEKTGRKIQELNGFPAVSLEQTLEIAHGYSDEYIREHFSQIESERLNYLFRRNVLELDMVIRDLWEELQLSKFQPIAFEMVFGENGEVSAIPVPGKRMDAQLRGVVDRVDLWQEGDVSFYRVVDYKTGKKDFDYCDVFNGLGLQMLLYLFALKEQGSHAFSGTAIPSGVQYFPARAPLVSADSILTEEQAEEARSKLWKRKGLLLHDETVMEAMEPGDNPNRCFSRKRDGSLSGEFADSRQFNLLMAYVFRLVGKMVDDIGSGCVDPNPYTRGGSFDACSYCPYGAICNKTSVTGRRNYKTMTAQRFWEEIEKEASKLG